MRIAIIAAAFLILGGCATHGFINADNPEPGSAAAKVAWKECRTRDAASHTKLAPKARLGLLLFVPVLVPHYEDVCNSGCQTARREQAQCMYRQGWAPCNRDSGHWRCDKVPS